MYVIVLEKQGYRPKLYVGSGTQAKYGVSNRLVQYNEAHVDKGRVLPLHMNLLSATAIPLYVKDSCVGFLFPLPQTYRF